MKLTSRAFIFTRSAGCWPVDLRATTSIQSLEEYYGKYLNSMAYRLASSGWVEDDPHLATDNRVSKLPVMLFSIVISFLAC